jgi:hypothetical protein
VSQWFTGGLTNSKIGLLRQQRLVSKESEATEKPLGVNAADSGRRSTVRMARDLARSTTNLGADGKGSPVVRKQSVGEPLQGVRQNYSTC